MYNKRAEISVMRCDAAQWQILRYACLVNLDIISAGGSVAIRRRQPLALLIYLAIVGTATRDQLALLLFNECDEALARSRLRHVLHELRQGRSRPAPAAGSWRADNP